MIPTNPELRQFINQFFSDDELETLCFDYFPEALNEFGGGMSKNRKVITTTMSAVGWCAVPHLRRSDHCSWRASGSESRPGLE